ncbi:MAG: mandelate racemase/muconate lactonizing enzyme family protein [SAR202 cluster bacterium]|nr:mandelate racemase/muconate lactonizing enzyme family protein [SAR202 cluster bacterium]
MKILDVTTTTLFYPEPATPSRPAGKGRSQLFVHVKTDAGIEGLGLGQAFPGVRQIVESDIKRVLLDQDPSNTERLWAEMHRAVLSHGRKGASMCALSAVDIALWDLKAKALGLPLFQLLGAYSDSVELYGSGGGSNLPVAELTREMKAWTDRGARRLKMKVAKDNGRAEREDIERVAAVREAVGWNVALYVDALGAYSTKQAVYMAREFEEYQVGWIEEPVQPEDFSGLSQVAGATDIPIAAGENEYNLSGLRELLTVGGVDILQPDARRMGGVTEWMKAAHLAHAFNTPVAPHAGQLLHIHLGCAVPNFKAVEARENELEADIAWYKDVPKPRNDRWAPFPDRPGLGLELNPYAVEKWSVAG